MGHLELDLQVACEQQTPSNEQMQRWAECALGTHREMAELSIRVVDEEEGTALNLQYRGKAGPTNVLSFPAELPAELQLPLIGDLAICAPVVVREAAQQNKLLEAHWAHMVIHGTLHLLGYDHIEDTDALEMESLEIRLMHQLGYDDPYQIQDTHQDTNKETRHE